MATITKFEDIIAWQKARQLCQRIFEIMNRGEFARDFKPETDRILIVSV